jgi:hypothetical protein
MNVILQVSTGLFHHCTEPDPEAVRKRLEALCDRLPVRGIIYGWGKRTGLYETILETAHRYGAEAWMWLPVFADVRAPEAAEPMISFGSASERGIAACPGEEFRFICPGSRRNLDALIETYEKWTAGCEPDGVFLDRIRYPSAVYSPTDFLGCGCEACRARLQQAGIDPQRLQARMARKKGLDSCLPDRMENGRYHYPDPDLEGLAQMKRSIITDSVGEYSQTFHKKGIKVGIDVFAPALADLVGQDLAALLPLTDLVKPMMYFRTLAPAGIPYELEAYGQPLAKRLAALWGTEIGEDASMERQLRSLGDSQGKICPGIEINRIPGICEPDGKGFRQAFRAAEAAGCDTMVLSWNVMKAREEELREIEF